MQHIDPQHTGGKQNALTQIERNLISVMLEFPSEPPGFWSELIQQPISWIQEVSKRPLFRKEFLKSRNFISTRLVQAQHAAINRIHELIQGEDERLALDASKFVLAPIMNPSNAPSASPKDITYRVTIGEGGAIQSHKAMNSGDAIDLLHTLTTAPHA